MLTSRRIRARRFGFSSLERRRGIFTKNSYFFQLLKDTRTPDRRGSSGSIMLHFVYLITELYLSLKFTASARSTEDNQLPWVHLCSSTAHPRFERTNRSADSPWSPSNEQKRPAGFRLSSTSKDMKECYRILMPCPSRHRAEIMLRWGVTLVS